MNEDEIRDQEEMERLAQEERERQEAEAAAKEEEERLEREREEKEQEQKYNEERKHSEEHKCAYCTHLEPEKKSEGRYYCNKLETYVKGTDTNLRWNCYGFEEAGRSVRESDLIMNDSEVLDNHTEGILNGRYCCDCRFYDVDKKAADGRYRCTKRDEDMLANTPECYMFEPTGRSSKENEKLYDEAKEAQKEADLAGARKGNVGGLLILAIILLIGAIVVNFFIKI